jgi:two-component system cell cycle sensor histidine kinase/response regulator CckA
MSECGRVGRRTGIAFVPEGFLSMPRADSTPDRSAGAGPSTYPLNGQPLAVLLIAAPAVAMAVGILAVLVGLIGSAAEIATAVIVRAVIVAFLMLGRTHPPARLGAAALLNLEAILAGAVGPAGMAFAIALPLIAVGLVQPMLRGTRLLAMFVVSGLAAVGGVAGAVFVGPAHGLFGTASGTLTVTAFAAVTIFALALDWRATYRLLGALDGAQAEIAARDAAEAELDRTSEILSAIVRSSPVATQAFAADRTITLWNPASERVFGWAAEELIGRSLPIEMIPVEDRATSSVRIDQTLSGTVQNGERVRRLTKTGEERWIDIYAAAIEDRQGRPIGIAGQLVDVTERVKLDAQLLQAQKMGAVGLLASSIAHDFNNTLTAALGFAELIAARTTGAVREDANTIVEVVERGRQLTRQLLDFSRRDEAAVLVVDLRHTVKGIEPLIRRLIGPTIEITVVLPKAPVPARLDPGQLEQAVINLAVNARDAMPAGGRLEIAIASWTTTRPAGRWSEIRVTDTGVGIPEAILDSIFEPFFTTKPVGSGTGLGLAMVRSFAEDAGGRLAVESTVGQGTTFRILLPSAFVSGAARRTRRRGQPAA